MKSITYQTFIFAARWSAAPETPRFLSLKLHFDGHQLSLHIRSDYGFSLLIAASAVLPYESPKQRSAFLSSNGPLGPTQDVLGSDPSAESDRFRRPASVQDIPA
jgi:hypothetical protein